MADPDRTGGVIRTTFRARFPSHRAWAMHYKLLLCDVLLIAYTYSLVRGYGLDALLRSFRAAFWLLPWGTRGLHRVVHFLLSIPILPAPLIFYAGAFRGVLPGALSRMQHEQTVECERSGLQLMRLADGVRVSFATADGVRLSGMFFMGHDRGFGSGRPDGPSIVRFNGNGEAWEYTDPGAVRDYTEKGMNLLVFNYRGVNASLWNPVMGRGWLGELLSRYLTLERDGAVLDSEAAIQYMTVGLGIPKPRLLLVGQSIGGAFALAAATGDLNASEVGVCSARSFSSLSATVEVHAAAFLGLPSDSRLGKFIRDAARFLVVASGWELLAVPAWRKVTGFKWLEFSRDDHIIPPSISLITSLHDDLGSERVHELAALPGDNHNRSHTIGELRQHLKLCQAALGLPA
mmetsp:Transcript_17664/g.42577  ORF Transcript_17664/g.42577 Transcript_17664/m.42577 type:complete len:404 (+) Transcript_17664:3-1214(+)